jgi:hypothetical protein
MRLIAKYMHPKLATDGLYQVGAQIGECNVVMMLAVVNGYLHGVRIDGGQGETGVPCEDPMQLLQLFRLQPISHPDWLKEMLDTADVTIEKRDVK